MEYTLQICRIPQIALPDDWMNMHPASLATLILPQARGSCCCAAGLDLSYAIEAGWVGNYPKAISYDPWRALSFAAVVIPASDGVKIIEAVERMLEQEGLCFPEDADQAYELAARLVPDLETEVSRVIGGELFVLFLM